jgi:hypothetical protein
MEYKLRTNNPDIDDESNLHYAARTGARTIARPIEQKLGFGGNALQSVQNLIDYGSKTITGKPSSIDVNDIIPGNDYINFVNDTISKFSGKPGPIPKIKSPTSKQLEEGSSYLTGGLTEPQTENEKWYDEVLGDVGLLFSDPSSIIKKGAGNAVKIAKGLGGEFVKSLTTSALGNTAKWATEEVTGSPLLGAAVKMGTMALASTAGGRKQLEQQEPIAYKNAYANLPEGTKSNFEPEIKKYGDIVEGIRKYPNVDKDYLLKTLKDIDIIPSENGKASVLDMINFKKGLNDHIFNGRLRGTTRKTLERARDVINEGIARYGKTNPDFYEPFKKAEELHRGLGASTYVKEFLSNNPKIEGIVDNPLIKYLLFDKTYKSVSNLVSPQAALIGSGALGLYESARAYKLLSESSLARDAYANLMKASLKGNVQAATKYTSQLNKAADDYEDKNPEDDSNLSPWEYRLRH